MYEMKIAFAHVACHLKRSSNMSTTPPMYNLVNKTRNALAHPHYRVGKVMSLIFTGSST